MAAKGCKGRGGSPRGKEYEGKRHGGGGGGKNKRRRRSAAAVEKTFETAERRNGKREIGEALTEAGYGNYIWRMFSLDDEDQHYGWKSNPTF